MFVLIVRDWPSENESEHRNLRYVDFQWPIHPSPDRPLTGPAMTYLKDINACAVQQLNRWPVVTYHVDLGC